MAISFELIPNNLRVPGLYGEFNNSFAVTGLVKQPYKILLIGQGLQTGSIEPLTPVQVSSADQAAEFFGARSMITAMVKAFRDNDPLSELVVIALDDNGGGEDEVPGGIPATGEINISGNATQAGIIYLYIAGTRLRIVVSAGMSATQVVSAMETVINRNDLPMSAIARANTVELISIHSGEATNGLDVRVNYHTGEQIPAGLSLDITPLSGGAGNPDLADALSAIGDTWYNLIINPFTDAANLSVIEQELASRFEPIRAIDGVAISAVAGNFSALSTIGDSRNSPHVCLFESHAYPKAPYVRAAMIAGIISRAAQNDPARPFQTLVLKGDMPPLETDRLTFGERNLLLFDGIATSVTDAGNAVRLERAITTYKTNAFGSPDPSYLDVNTLLTLSYLRFTMRARIAQKYARHKLAKDGTRFGPGQAIVTPKIMRAELIALFGDWERIGLVEDLDQFKRDLIVEINQNDPNRLDVILPPNLVNQLRILAVRIDFRL